MKIGVVTYWNTSDNYGQLLQAWALQYWLKQHGHDAFIIRYDFKEDISNVPYKARINRYLKWLYLAPIINRIIYRKRYIDERLKNKHIKSRAFDIFRSQYLKFSNREYTSLDQLKTFPPEADCYIVGSDQVWARPLTFYHNRAYFLDFGRKEIKRISYAPSFAMTEYPKENLKDLSQLLSKFNYISVREFSGINICKDLGYTAKLVCDPTLLLTKQDYLEELKGNSDTKNSIYLYCLNIKEPSELRWDDLKKFANQENLKIVITTASGYFPGKEIFVGKVEYKYCTIQQWISNINDARMVVTPSFHGIVFSIITHTPFIYIPLKGLWASGNNRVFDLLESLGLSDRVLSDEKDYENIFRTPIDWANVENLLLKIRSQSEDFLKSALR